MTKHMKPFGAVGVPIDQLPDRLRNAIETAERSDGYAYGAFFDDGRRCFVSVIFYPVRRWIISYGDGEQRNLDRDTFARLERIRL